MCLVPICKHSSQKNLRLEETARWKTLTAASERLCILTIERLPPCSIFSTAPILSSFQDPLVDQNLDHQEWYEYQGILEYNEAFCRQSQIRELLVFHSTEGT